MSYLNLSIIWFRLSYPAMHHWKETNNIGPNYCKSRDGGKPLQIAVIRSRIHVQYNVQVGCYLCHSDMKLTIYSSGHPMSFRYHLPLLFHTTQWWIHIHLSQVATNRKQADQGVLHHIRNFLAHSKNTDTSQSTATLPMKPPKIWPRMHI